LRPPATRRAARTALLPAPLLALAATGCHALFYGPQLPSSREARTAHYAIRTDGGAEDARRLARECERMLAVFEALLPPPDRRAFEAAARRAPFELVAIEDGRAFRATSQRHGAGAVEGFFCEDGGECVLGPGLARRLGPPLPAPPPGRAREAGGRELHAHPAGERLAWAGAADTHVLYHEGFHQYLARLGARNLETAFAEGLAEWYARRAASEPGQPFAAERIAEGAKDLALGARAALAQAELVIAPDDLSDVRLADQGVSLTSYRIYHLWIAFLAEGEGGRLRPALERALAQAISGGPARVDLAPWFRGKREVREAFRAVAREVAAPRPVRMAGASR
jgi:hypothetical protein